LAIDTDKANEQHYEVDASFYEMALGKRKKYSSCYYHADESLDKAEENMLELYCERGQFQEGQNILELGCGWGSLTLFLAEKYPNATITGLSNSHSQRIHILDQAQKQGLSNIKIITCDINEFEISEKFDRIVSIEMFEHVRNYKHLFNKISTWLKQDGLLFIHVFCHRYLMYPFLTEGSDNWMGKYFFSGGQMPAADTFLYFQDDLNIERRWMNSGQHYEKTSNHWLKNMDAHKLEVMNTFKQIYGNQYKLWFQRWRIFFMSCAELFGYNKGNEWLVGHYLFSKKS
jgi:cyclopropane-fatty-acyl-phospholipid synthase